MHDLTWIAREYYGQPLCGWEWYQQHRNDYTQRDIDSLTIQVKVDNCRLPTVNQMDKRGIVKDLVKSYRGVSKCH